MLTTQAELDKYSLNSVKTAKGKFTPPSVFLNCKASLPWLFFFYCSGFCHTLKWNSHGFTCVPHPYPPSHLPLPWLIKLMVKKKACVSQKFSMSRGQKRSPKGADLSIFGEWCLSHENAGEGGWGETFWVHHIYPLLMDGKKARNKPLVHKYVSL